MTGSDVVTLEDGRTLPLAAVRLAWNLQGRGVELRVDGDGLMVGPRAKLSDADRREIRRWKAYLLVLLIHEPRGVQ